jgi:hypothetical protein
MKNWAGGGIREKTQRQRRETGHDTAEASTTGPLSLLPHPVPPTRTDLLESTARLSLATARQVRNLCAIACRTIISPAATPYGCAIATIAKHEK